MARTNIEIDEDLAQRVMRRHGIGTKRAMIDMALRRLDIEPMSRDDALEMQGTGWKGNLDELRSDPTHLDRAAR
ncbi:MAG: type II toxin-antitoxin system VapB family antitoxin [Thermoleophilaceae bacterium]|jgi:Arc/MetJ family transcription regulator|nr:type II toxin-antitoxin system VapB family antitoxin [Thermoleophilaceae bacterium]